MVGKKIAQLQHSEKVVKEIGTPKMRQPRMITGDFEVSGRSSHPETYLTKSEVRLRLAKTDETPINRAFGASRRPRNAPDPGRRTLRIVKGIITGAAGLSCGYLIQELLEHWDEVFGLDNCSKYGTAAEVLRNASPLRVDRRRHQRLSTREGVAFRLLLLYSRRRDEWRPEAGCAEGSCTKS